MTLAFRMAMAVSSGRGGLDRQGPPQSRAPAAEATPVGSFATDRPAQRTAPVRWLPHSPGGGDRESCCFT